MQVQIRIQWRSCGHARLLLTRGRMQNFVCTYRARRGIKGNTTGTGSVFVLSPDKSISQQEMNLNISL